MEATEEQAQIGQESLFVDQGPVNFIPKKVEIAAEHDVQRNRAVVKLELEILSENDLHPLGVIGDLRRSLNGLHGEGAAEFGVTVIGQKFEFNKA